MSLCYAGIMRPTLSATSSLAMRAERLLPRIYVVVALLIGITLALLTPPFFIPDEPNHVLREIEIAHGDLVEHRGPSGVGAPMDTNLIAVIHRMSQLDESATQFVAATKNGRVTETDLAPIRALGWNHTYTFTNFLNTAVYPPPLYIPAAVGWKIAEAAQLTIVHSLLLARIFSTLCAVAIGWLALRLAGRERWLLFAFLLLPIDLSLSASCSQDALLAPLSALAIVLLIRAISAHRLQTTAELAATTLLLAICIAARPPYLPLALLLLLPVIEAGRPSSKAALAPLVGIIAIVALVGSWQLIVRPLGNMVGPGALPAQQVAFLKSHPLHGSVIVAFSTLRQVPPLVLTRFDLLGTNNVLPSNAIRILLLAVTLGILFLAPQVSLRRPQSYALLAVLLLAIVAGISLAEYVMWTPPASNQIEGLQARYYLPLVPATLLAVAGLGQSGTKKLPDNQRERWLLVATAVLILIVGYTPWLAEHRFYAASLPETLHAAIS
jgi:uncharacterized membrane protein